MDIESHEKCKVGSINNKLIIKGEDKIDFEYWAFLAM